MHCIFIPLLQQLEYLSLEPGRLDGLQGKQQFFICLLFLRFGEDGRGGDALSGDGGSVPFGYYTNTLQPVIKTTREVLSSRGS